jgi:hypothetical protein
MFSLVPATREELLGVGGGSRTCCCRCAGLVDRRLTALPRLVLYRVSISHETNMTWRDARDVLVSEARAPQPRSPSNSALRGSRRLFSPPGLCATS